MWAVVPIKTFADAKQRLAPVLPPQARRRLAQAMCADVLGALAAARGLHGVAVVTVDAVAREIAAAAGARVIDRFAEEGHSAAVNGAAALLAAEGAEAIVTMPGDIPRVTADEVDQVVAARSGPRDFIIVPAHDRRGSNTILCSPPRAVPLAFGNDSFLPHLAAARAAGLEPRILELPGIGQDIDNPEDLHSFMLTPSTTRTFALLQQLLAAGKP